MSGKLTVPQMNANDVWVELSSWLVKDGEKIGAGDEICEFATSKASFVFESPSAGYVRIMKRPGSKLKAGELFAFIAKNKSDLPEAGAFSKTEKARETVFTRKALQRMRELHLSDEDFRGFDYVVEKDVLQKAGPSCPRATLAKQEEIRVLRQAYATALRSSLTVQADAGPVLAKSDQTGIAVQAITAFHVARVLSAEDSPFGAVTTFNYAMDMGGGIKPVAVRDYADWTERDWHRQILDWGMKIARAQILPEELALGRLTLTDLSGLGVSFFEPLLVGEQAAILGIGGNLKGAAPQLSFTLAFDHRLHSGREIALFLSAVCARLENP